MTDYRAAGYMPECQTKMNGVDFIMFLCPNCGRTIKHVPSYYMPNLICQCDMGGSGRLRRVFQMVQVWPPTGEKHEEKPV